jgi:hypothetical protein
MRFIVLEASTYYRSTKLRRSYNLNCDYSIQATLQLTTPLIIL